MITVVVCLATAGLVAYWRRVGAPRRRLPEPIARRDVEATSRWRSRQLTLLVMVAAGAVGTQLGWVAGLAAAVYLAGGARLIAVERERRRWRSAYVSCARAMAGLAADVRAGGTPTAALLTAVDRMRAENAHPVWSRVVAAVRSDHELIRVLRAMPVPFALPCRRLATVLHLADVGIGLSAVLHELETELIELVRFQEKVAAAAAGARATIVVLLALPIMGVGLGYAFGADSLSVLTRTVPGVGCLGAGMALQGVGAMWAYRMTSGAGRVA